LIGLIGGSGSNTSMFLSGLAGLTSHTMDTPYGQPSNTVAIGNGSGCKIAFLPRHGDGHHIPPHAINYRANLWALKECGVEKIIALNAVGAIDIRMEPGHLALPDQVLDYTWGRAHTFFDGSDGVVEHVDFTVPYDESLRMGLKQAAEQLDIRCHHPCVYASVQGPRLESSAEIIRFERDGADLVGMTGMPEAGLARELSIPYAALCIVANPAAGKGEGEISLEEIFANLETGMSRALRVVEQFLSNQN